MLSDIFSGFQGKIENLDPVNTRVLPVSISEKISDNQCYQHFGVIPSAHPRIYQFDRS